MMMRGGGVHEGWGSGWFREVALGVVEVDEACAAANDGFFAGGNQDGAIPRWIEKDAGEFGEGGFVEAIQDFVEEKQARAGDDGSGDEESDSLAAGEGKAASEEGGVDAFGEIEDVLEESDGVEGRIDVINGDIGMSEANVFGDGAVDEVGGANEGDLGAEAFKIPATKVELINDDMAFSGHSEAMEEIEHGAGAAALGAEQSHALAGFEAEVDVGEDGFPGAVFEGDIAHLDAGTIGESERGITIFALDFEIDEMTEFVDSREGIVPGFELFAQF